jgi:SWI/SNF-related matrix-associated actin-dependent regulator of chromatin subfamily A3
MSAPSPLLLNLISRILNIYAARSDYRLALENELVWATPGQRGFGQFAAGSQTGITGTSASPKKPGSSSKKAGGGAPSAAQTEYERRIREAAEAKRFGAEKAAQLRRILSGLESVNDEGRRASLLVSCGHGQV